MNYILKHGSTNMKKKLMYTRQAIPCSAWKINESDFATHWNCHSFWCG